MTSATPTVKAKCFPYNLEEPNLDAYYPDLPKRFPPNYICQHQKRDSFNQMLEDRREAMVRGGGEVTTNVGHQISPSASWRMKEVPTDNKFDQSHLQRGEVIQLGGRGDQHYGYAQNVDVESELKRINHLADKCFNDKYKVRPENPNNALHQHQGLIQKDYLGRQKNTYLDSQLNPLECLKGTSQFKVSPYVKPDDQYAAITFDFNNDPAAGYPPQKAWHNVTKRRMLYTGYSCCDLGKPVKKC